MQHNFLTRLLLTLTLLVGFSPSVWADEHNEAARYAGFEALPAAQEGDVVFIGNSITHMMNWWEAFGNKHNIHGRGNSGAKTYQALANLESMIAGQPSKAFVMLGTNDFGNGDNPQHVALLVKTLCKRILLESPRTTVYLQSILPSNNGTGRNQANMTAANSLLEAWVQAENNERLVYVDLYALLDNGNGSIKNAGNDRTTSWSYDDLHLTPRAYRVWMNEIEQYLDGAECVIPDNDDLRNLHADQRTSWGARIATFGTMPVTSNDILMFGDDFIHYGEWHELMNSTDFKDRGTGWQFFSSDLGCVKASLDPALSKTQYNVTTCGVVRETPRAIGICAGGRNIMNGQTDAQVQSAFNEVVTEARRLVGNETPIFLMSVLPLDNATKNAQVVALNDYMKQLAQSDAHTYYVDIYGNMTDASGNRIADYFHANRPVTINSVPVNPYPTPLGYVKAANVLADAVNGAIADPNGRSAGYQPITLEQAQHNIDRFAARTIVGNAVGAAVSKLFNVGDGIGQYTATSVAAAENAVAEACKVLYNGTELTTDLANEAIAPLANLNLEQNLTPQLTDAQGHQQYYTFKSQRNNRYVTAQTGNSIVLGVATKEVGSYWCFVRRTQDSDYDLVNYLTGEYISADGVSNGSALKLVSASPNRGWHISASKTDGYLYIDGTNIQFNQSNSTNVLNWIDTTTGGDAGCNYTIEAVDYDALPSIPEDNLDTKIIRIGSASASALSKTTANGRAQYYVMKNFGRSYYIKDNGDNATGVSASPSGTSAANNPYIVTLEQLTIADGTTTAKIRFAGSGNYLAFPASNNQQMLVNATGTTVTLSKSAQGTDGWYITSGASYMNGNASNPVTWNAAEANSTYYFLPVSFEDAEELTYQLTDGAGTVHTYTARGTAGQTTPTISGAAGATLSDGSWDGATYKATVTFPFAVSKQGGTSNYVGISAFGTYASKFYYYAKDSGVRVTKDSQPSTTAYVWCIYPSIDATGKFTFTVKNVSTGTYIYSTSGNNDHSAAAVTLSTTGSAMTYDANGFRLSTGKYLSVNSSSPVGEQIVGTWDSHDGTKLAFADLNTLRPTEPETPAEGTISYTLNLDHENLGHLMPQPRSVSLTGTSATLAGNINIIYNVQPAEGSPLPAVMARFLEETHCTAGEGTNLHVNFVETITGTEDYTVADFDNEAYAIKIDGQDITVSAIKPIGVIRAMQTLTMMAKENSNTLTGCEIVDWPAFKVRGLMHDIGRSYISVEELKQEIDLLARFKENVFLWHLTDKHGFRFESKEYPQVNTNFSPSRSQKFYTQDECREVSDYAYERGITIIPEIDMPGHSERFQGAMGYTMASEPGRAALKKILGELARTFNHSPYIHIGGDETAEATIAYINEMADYVRQNLGRKVVVWNQFGGGNNRQSVNVNTLHVDMSTNWATSGVLSRGIPNIDIRYNYINHFDMFGDLAGIYRSNIFGVQKGNSDVAGSITGIWNDRLISDEKLIVRENNLYANALATAERGWKGGGRHYSDEAEGGAYLPNSGDDYDEFKDWETRFLYHKRTTLAEVKSLIPYTKQTHMRWNITKAYQNGGVGTKVFAPEQTENLVPEAGDITATGAGIWLNHIWAGTVAGVLGKAAQAQNQTRYAWTYVYSPEARDVKAQVETYNYSRSQKGGAPANRKWDHRGSQIWLNSTELVPAVDWTTTGSGEENELGNLNFTAREPLNVHLDKGWNKVLLKLPYTGQNPGAYGSKWMFTFFFTDAEGDAVEGLIYSPAKCIDENAEALSAIIQEARTYIATTCNDKVGYYPSDMADELATLAENLYASLGDENVTADQRTAQSTQLRTALNALKSAVAGAGQGAIVRPANGATYTLKADRGSKYATSNGKGQGMTGDTSATPQAMWTFSAREDGTYDIKNFADGTYLTPHTQYNTTLISSDQCPAKGWALTPSATSGYFLITTTAGSQNNELHQTNQAAVYNWGWENNSTVRDADGCRYFIEEIPEDFLPRRVSVTYQVEGTTTFASNNYRLGELNIACGSTAVAIPEVTDNGKTFEYLVNPGQPITISERLRYHGWNTPTVVRSTVDTLQFTVTYKPNLKEESQYLWYTTKDNHPYRIPAIAKMADGRLLAVMDYRTCGDDIGMGEVDLVGRIGSADGKEWGEAFMIADGDGNSSQYPYFGCGYGDAAVVADAESGKVVIMCVSGKVRYTNANASTHPCVARIESDDYGQNWKITNVTDQFLGKSTSLLPNSYALFFGSGRIVQSKQVKVPGSDYYRLYASIVSRGDSNSNGNFVVYSDDFGTTWQFLGGNTTCARNGNEPKVEELPNGDIMLSSRKGSGRYFNVFHFTNFANDKTAGTWGSQTNSNGITAADCNGEIIILDAYKTYDGKKTQVLLQSVPCNNSTRRDVGIYYKEIEADKVYTANDIANNWTKGMAVSTVESAYSTMVQQEDGRLAFLFEEAPTWNNTFGYAEVYRPISIFEATSGAFQLEPVTEPTKDAYLKYFNTEEDRAAGQLSWVRIRNVRDNGYTAYVANATSNTVGSHQNGAQDDSDLFAFVGTPNDFKIYSKTYGIADGKALGYANSNRDTAVVPGGVNTSFRLVEHASEGTFLITPLSNADQSWNMHGGAGQNIKFYNSTDGGANWKLDLVSLSGDITGEGHYSQLDVEALDSIVRGVTTKDNNPENYNFGAADLNNDGVYTIGDIARLIRLLLETEKK